MADSEEIHGKFWINLINCGFFLNLILIFSKSILLVIKVYRIAGLVANSEGPDQPQLSVAPDLGLHYLPRLIFPKMSKKYANLINSNPTPPPKKSS